MTRRIPLVTVLAFAAAVALVASTTAAAKRKPPSCTRDGATLVAAEGKVRVVRVKHTPGKQRTRNEALLACWTSTGKRGEILREQDFGDDFQERTQFEIVDGRWIGAYELHSGGITESATALVYDPYNRKTVHRSAGTLCDAERGDFSGPDDVAFLPNGGMALACNRLLMLKDRSSTTAQELEPNGTFVFSLGVSQHHRGFGPRLYWTVESANQQQTTKSIPL
jgi:hypothetical protein